MSAHRIAVAYSGGRDSTALLHATIVQARAAGVAVIALHVQHGLSAHAEAWWRHCDAQCAEWASAGLPVVFAGHRVVERPAAGESVEAWARAARYRALRELALANDARVVLLAHHRRDQAETWLLQALRGAGTAGLSAMPERAQRQGIVWERPWLARPREAIEAYLQQHGLRYIDDDSNADQRHARNRLRLQVWPALTAAFPHTETALATAARWAQQAGDALDELAQIDLARIADDAGLHLAAWLALSEARRSNALRAWLATVLPTAAPAALTLRLLDELPHGRAARWPVPAGELRMYRGVLTHARHEPHHAEQSASHAGLQRETMLAILEAGAYRLPGWGGVLHAERVRAHGVPVAWLIRLELRERRGDQRFQMGIGRPPRSLKKQFQQVGIPAWQREGPLVYSGDQLLFVPGLGLDARVLGVPGQVLAGLRWVGDGEAGGAPKAAG